MDHALVTPKRLADELHAIAAQWAKLQLRLRSVAVYLGPDPLRELHESLWLGAALTTDLAAKVRVGAYPIQYTEPSAADPMPLFPEKSDGRENGERPRSDGAGQIVGSLPADAASEGQELAATNGVQAVPTLGGIALNFTASALDPKPKTKRQRKRPDWVAPAVEEAKKIEPLPGQGSFLDSPAIDPRDLYTVTLESTGTWHRCHQCRGDYDHLSPSPSAGACHRQRIEVLAIREVPGVWRTAPLWELDIPAATTTEGQIISDQLEVAGVVNAGALHDLLVKFGSEGLPNFVARVRAGVIEALRDFKDAIERNHQMAEAAQQAKAKKKQPRKSKKQTANPT